MHKPAGSNVAEEACVPRTSKELPTEGPGISFRGPLYFTAPGLGNRPDLHGKSLIAGQGGRVAGIRFSRSRDGNLAVLLAAL